MDGLTGFLDVLRRCSKAEADAYERECWGHFSSLDSEKHDS